jgi:hypothetical protein
MRPLDPNDAPALATAKGALRYHQGIIVEVYVDPDAREVVMVEVLTQSTPGGVIQMLRGDELSRVPVEIDFRVIDH